MVAVTFLTDKKRFSSSFSISLILSGPVGLR